MLCLSSSCVKEDLSECNPGVLLKFDYSLNPQDANLFGPEVDKVTVYAFDDKGLFYGSFSDAGKHLTNDWEMRLPLPPGDYTVVAWGGALGSYRVGETDAEGTAFRGELKKGVTHIDNFMLTAERAGQPLKELDHLYHGKREVTSVFNPQEAETVDLMRNTNHLTVTVEDPLLAGGKASGDSAPYEVVCTGKNGRYLAGNNFGRKAETVTNVPYNSYVEPGKAVSELNVLRLVIGEPFQLTVKDGDGKKIFDRDLIQTMTSTGHFKTQEDFDRETDFDVVIRVERENVIAIIINGWVAVEIIPDL